MNLHPRCPGSTGITLPEPDLSIGPYHFFTKGSCCSITSSSFIKETQIAPPTQFLESHSQIRYANTSSVHPIKCLPRKTSKMSTVHAAFTNPKLPAIAIAQGAQSPYPHLGSIKYSFYNAAMPCRDLLNSPSSCVRKWWPIHNCCSHSDPGK